MGTGSGCGSLSDIGITGLPAAWGKAPPGTADSVALDLPGANGNYPNGDTSSLLGMSNNCPPGKQPQPSDDERDSVRQRWLSPTRSDVESERPPRGAASHLAVPAPSKPFSGG
jgi:hypothetical protein